MKRGFTLVELSIVLVIIGLLIGGILVAQSMISTARINSTVQQISQFDAGAMSFKARHNYLPGDAPGFGGDGDGAIDITPVSGWDDYTTVFACEIANFWHNINPSEYTGTDCAVTLSAGVQATLSGPLKRVPIAKMGKPNSFFVAVGLSTDGSVVDKTNLRNVYAILSSAQSQTLGAFNGYHFLATTSDNSAVTPADLFALDRKLDDGLADSGYVLSGSTMDNGGYGAIVPNALPTCSSNADYELGNTGSECTPIIQIGGHAGLPQ